MQTMMLAALSTGLCHQTKAMTCSCRNQGQEDVSAGRVAELERQLTEARSGKDPEMNDENSRIVSMLADVSPDAYPSLLTQQISFEVETHTQAGAAAWDVCHAEAIYVGGNLTVRDKGEMI